MRRKAEDKGMSLVLGGSKLAHPANKLVPDVHRKWILSEYWQLVPHAMRIE